MGRSATGASWVPQDVTRFVVAADSCDAWALHDAGFWLLVPTNMQRRTSGDAVMGAGLAGQAAARFPDLPERYGRCLASGQVRAQILEHRLLPTPTKDHWRSAAVPALVRDLLGGVASWCTSHPAEALALPAPGCGLGGLPWTSVRREASSRLAGCRVLLTPPL